MISSYQIYCAIISTLFAFAMSEVANITGNQNCPRAFVEYNVPGDGFLPYEWDCRQLAGKAFDRDV